MPIKKLASALAAVTLLVLPLAASANEGSYPHAGNDVRNIASLQRGARNFMNYCSGCHSAKFVRYNRVAADLNIPEPELKKNLMFTSDKPFDTIKSALPPDDAKRWFGTVPPDLSLMARARGSDYIYAFLRSFYRDPSRPTGAGGAGTGARWPPGLSSSSASPRRSSGRPAGRTMRPASSDSGSRRPPTRCPRPCRRTSSATRT